MPTCGRRSFVQGEEDCTPDDEPFEHQIPILRLKIVTDDKLFEATPRARSGIPSSESPRPRLVPSRAALGRRSFVRGEEECIYDDVPLVPLPRHELQCSTVSDVDNPRLRWGGVPGRFPSSNRFLLDSKLS